MPTLEEILNESLGVEQPMPTEKVASAVAETDEIEKLAMEIGLVDTKTEPASQPVQTKEAQMSLSNMYNELFPEDAALNKTAADGEQEKLAAAEEALGALAYDAACERFDARITKLAAEAITKAVEPPQQLPNNKAGGNAMIDTTPAITNELPPEKGQAVVGDEESKAKEMQVKAAACLRKHMLLSQIEE